jgi:hypothetical protein
MHESSVQFLTFLNPLNDKDIQHTGDYTSPNIIREIKSWRMRWVGHVAHMGERRNSYGILVGKPEGKRQLRRPRHSWEVNIRMDLRGMGWEGVDWMHLVQDRDQWWTLVNTVNLQGSTKGREFLD